MVSGFKERRSQLKLMGEFALAFAAGCQQHRGDSGDWLGVVEAPTAVGKSAAGAAAAAARERIGKRWRACALLWSRHYESLLSQG